MTDLVFLGLATGFFVLSWGFVLFCASLEPAKEERK
jgi:hypothetical protein